jgi:hypothetical protein
MNAKMKALADPAFRPNEEDAQAWTEVANGHLIRWGNGEDDLFDADKVELILDAGHWFMACRGQAYLKSTGDMHLAEMWRMAAVIRYATHVAYPGMQPQLVAGNTLMYHEKAGMMVHDKFAERSVEHDLAPPHLIMRVNYEWAEDLHSSDLAEPGCLACDGEDEETECPFCNTRLKCSFNERKYMTALCHGWSLGANIEQKCKDLPNKWAHLVQLETGAGSGDPDGFRYQTVYELDKTALGNTFIASDDICTGLIQGFAKVRLPGHVDRMHQLGLDFTLMEQSTTTAFDTFKEAEKA